MKSLKSILLAGALTLSALGLGGCSSKPAVYVGDSSQTSSAQPLSVSGRPISIGESYGQGVGSISLVVDVGGTNYLAHSRISYNTAPSSDAQALINAEITKGLEGKVELSGKYEGRVFKFNKLKAGGYEINF